MEAKKAKRRLKQKRRNLKAGELTKGQKKHLKDFGELHPIDDEDSAEDEKESSAKKKKKIEKIIDESIKRPKKYERHSISRELASSKTEQSDEDEDEDEDDEDEEDKDDELSPYNQLVSSFGNGVASHLSRLTKTCEKSKNSESFLKMKELKVKQPEASSGENRLDKSLDQSGAMSEDEIEKDKDFTELEDDNDLEPDDDVQDNLSNEKMPSDPFSLHFEHELPDNLVQILEDRKSLSEKPLKRDLNTGLVMHYPPSAGLDYNPIISTTPLDSDIMLEKLWIKAKLCKNWQKSYQGTLGPFTPLQQEIFPIFNAYQDLLYTNRTFLNGDEIRRLYCLHALNHILKTRSRILKNNAKNVQAQKEGKELPGEQRDHGLTRPKVLILVPFRDCALKIVNILLDLLMEPGQGQVMNKKRFLEEFGDTKEADSGFENKPDDFKQLFNGNTDDFFRVGLVVMRKAIKLFTEFYSSDIIIASPVGLRAIIGAEGEKKRDYDFLSSIEVLIMDQADVFLMQNWEHVQHIFDYLHLQPKESHDVDFSRVRMWNLNGLSKFYRQTMVFSDFMSPEFNFIFNKHCFRKAKLLPSKEDGSVCQVAVQIPQVFHRVIASNHKEITAKRFDFFISKVLPDLRSATGFSSHTAIFVSSYFDFVRLRNYLKKEEIEFLQLSEYTTRANISRSRSSFLNGEKPLLLFTERFYFYYRYRIRGIRNIVFYELPYYAQFYSEIVNYMDTASLESGSDTNATSSVVLYSKFDAHKLARVVGSQRCQQMLTSQQTVHMFVTGDEN